MVSWYEIKKIKGYFERKYGVDLSQVIVERDPTTWIPIYDISEKRIIFPSKLSYANFLATLGIINSMGTIVAGTLRKKPDIAVAGMFLLLLCSIWIYVTNPNKRTIAHKLAHAVWYERIRKYNGLPFDNDCLGEAFAVWEASKYSRSLFGRILEKFEKIILTLQEGSRFIRYIKLFEILDNINFTSKPKSLEEIVRRIENSKLSENDKRLLIKIIKEESENLKDIWKYPGVLPEKHHLIEKLTKYI